MDCKVRFNQTSGCEIKSIRAIQAARLSLTLYILCYAVLSYSHISRSVEPTLLYDLFGDTRLAVGR
jgi:hypothetical protein